MPVTERIKGRPWSRIRRAVFAREPLCRSCLARNKTVGAEEVDHIIPLHLGGGHDFDNLQPLCRRCHAAKTETERPKRHPPPEWAALVREIQNEI